MVLMANRYILPAAFEQKEHQASVAAVRAVGGAGQEAAGDLHEAGRQVQGADRRVDQGARARPGLAEEHRESIVRDRDSSRDGQGLRGGPAR